jgi:hypothetical protein
MEFDEINTLINIEREAYQRDLARGIIGSTHIPATPAPSFLAERAAMMKVKSRFLQVKNAMKQLALAMDEHAKHLKGNVDSDL